MKKRAPKKAKRLCLFIVSRAGKPAICGHRAITSMYCAEHAEHRPSRIIPDLGPIAYE